LPSSSTCLTNFLSAAVSLGFLFINPPTFPIYSHVPLQKKCTNWIIPISITININMKNISNLFSSFNGFIITPLVALTV
jgi:hypothetical protein